MTGRPPPRPPSAGDIWHDGPTEPPRRKERAAGGRNGRSPARRGRPRRSPIVVFAGIAALTVACLCIGAVAFLLVASPVDGARDRVIEQVKARTGRDLVVGGATSLSLFPRLAVSMTDVSLSAPEGMDSPPTLVVPMLEVDLRFWSLVTRQPAVERITLHRPAIDLSIDAQGRRSWDAVRPPREGAGAPTPSAGANGPPPASPTERPAGNPEGGFAKFGAMSIRVIDATVRYSDRGSGARTDISALNFMVAVNDAAGVLEVAGSLAVRGDEFKLSGTAAPAGALFSRQPAEVALKLTGTPFDATYEGAMQLGDGVSLDGAIAITAKSARSLGAWLGRPLPSSADADAVTANARVKAVRGQIALSAIEASIGTSAMAGNLTVSTGQGRPRLDGNLKLSELDFGQLLRRPDTAPPVAASSSPAAAPAAPSSAPVAPHQPPAAPQAKAKDWNDDPINLPALGVVDADLAVSAGRLLYKDIKTGPSRLALSLNSGVAKITLEDIELYGGRGRGTLTLDAAREKMVAVSNLRLEGVSLQPLLTDALRVSWFEGRSSMSLALIGQGLTERQIVETITGTVEVTGADGALAGIDVGKALRSLQHAKLPNLTPSPNERTPFKQLSATFAVSNGVAKNQDLKLAGPNLQLNGDGIVNLGQRQIDYTLRTKISGGQPEADAQLKVEIPISVVGPWERPAFGVRGQEQLSDAVRQIGKNFKSPEAQDALKGLMKGDGDRRVKARELLEKLLKKE